MPKKQTPKSVPKKQTPKSGPKKQTPKSGPKKQTPKSMPKKQIVRQLSKKQKPRSQKRLSKSSSKKRNKSRKISIHSQKKNIQNIETLEKKINEIRKRKPSEIKKELEQKGIKVSGKSNRLLKDIYLYSQVSGINIIHEK